MSIVLIIGCGGVASVAIHKCCQVPEVFTEICIASRTKSKCDKLAAELAPKTTTKITTAQVDAARLIDRQQAVVVVLERAQLHHLLVILRGVEREEIGRASCRERV